MSESPFVPGARVAVISGYRGEHVREGFVERVYKNGNVTLRGDKSRQQYRPSGGSGSDWAHATGDHRWNSPSLHIWNAEHDAHLNERVATSLRSARLRNLKSAVDRLRLEQVTDEMLSAIEAVLPRA